MSKRYIVSTEQGYYGQFNRIDAAKRCARRIFGFGIFKTVKVYDNRIHSYVLECLKSN